MTERNEASIRRPMMVRILALAGPEMILVGGQALSFWASYYDIPEPAAAITKDADFLGTQTDVRRIATGLGGRARFPHKSQLTALMGSIEKDLPGADYVNIDVMFRVFGDVTAEAIRSRAVKVELGEAVAMVMHPMDVLQGRLENVHGLQEKQDAHGLEQLSLAIRMGRAFLLDEAARDGPEVARPRILKHLSRIEAMALGDAGRKVAARFGLYVADAIECEAVLSLKSFRTRKLPQLLKLMSATRCDEAAAWLAANKSGPT